MSNLVDQKQYLSNRLEQLKADLAYANDGWRDKGLEPSLRRMFHNMALKCRSEIAWIRVQLRKVELDILQMELVQVRDEGLFVASVLQDPEVADLHAEFIPTWGDLVGRQTELVQEISALRSQM